MIKGISLGETSWFTCKDDRENPTRWKIGVIDALVMAEIQDLITVFEPDYSNMEGPAKSKLCLNRVKSEAVRYGLKGWENFVDSTGSAVPFRTERRTMGGRTVDALPDELMQMIPFVIVTEIGDKILTMNRLNEGEVKN